MSLDKAILYGKEKRKKFYGSKRVDRSCRNHGGKSKKKSANECPWCLENRLYSSKVREEKYK